VAGEHAAYEGAIDGERAARAQVLASVIEVLRPALRAICSRVDVAGVRSTAGTTRDAAGWRGVRLVGTGIVQDPGDSIKRGEYKGHDLFLDEAGHLAELSYAGRWSSVHGEVSHWRSEVKVHTARQVVEDYDLGAILDRLVAVLEEQLQGDKAGNTRAIQARAARVTAVATMIRGTL
jgi:hypothetical protein